MHDSFAEFLLFQCFSGGKTKQKKKGAAFMLWAPHSLPPNSDCASVTAPFHKSHLLPVSQMRPCPSEEYYSRGPSLPSPIPCTITLFKGIHSYLCSFPTLPFFLSVVFLCAAFFFPSPLHWPPKKQIAFTESQSPEQPACPQELAAVCCAAFV